MKPISTLLALFSLFFGVQLHSQEIAQIEFSPKLDPSEVEKVRPLLTKLLEDYQRYARLYDAELGSTNATKNEFVRLFQVPESEMVFGDFLKEPTNTDVYRPLDYANEALARGYSNGIDFQLTRIEVLADGIVLNDHGYYDVTAQVTKKILNPYDSDEGIVLNEIYVSLAFLFGIDPEDTEEPASILSIRNTQKFTLNEKPKVYIAPMFGVGTGFYSLGLSDYWNENNADRATLEVSSALQISFGVDWLFTTGLKKDAAKQRWAWIIGVQGNYNTYRSEITNMQTPVFRETVTGAPNEASTTFDSWSTVHVLDETTRIYTADLKLGMGWRATFNQQETNADKNRKVNKYLWINVKAIPSFGLFNTVEADGIGTYDGIATEETSVNPSTLRFLRENAIEDLQDAEWRFYERGEDIDVISEASSVPMSTFGLKLEVSPTWYFDRTTYGESETKWELSIGFDLGYQFISNFEHDNFKNVDDDAYRFKDDINTSVLNSYASSLRGPYFMFKIGLNRRNQKF